MKTLHITWADGSKATIRASEHDALIACRLMFDDKNVVSVWVDHS